MANPIPSLERLALKCVIDTPSLLLQQREEPKPIIDLIQNQWNRLKENAPQGPIDIPNMMYKVETELSNSPVNFLFFRLRIALLNAFQQASLQPGRGCIVEPSQLVLLQDRMQEIEEQKALVTIWPVLRNTLGNPIPPTAPPENATYPMIRTWLEAPANQDLINQIQHLDLPEQNLSVLPRELRHFHGLTTLHLNNNQLRYLPDWIGEFNHLTVLDLTANLLTKLPDSLCNLRTLTLLNLSQNNLHALPDNLGNLVNLDTLFLVRCQLPRLPQSITHLSALRVLNLNENCLNHLPELLGELQELRELHVSHNFISFLPESLQNSRHLALLYLENNRLTALPEWIGNFHQLEELEAKGNFLTHLPPSFDQLTQLRVLGLSHNFIEDLPASVGNMTQLEALELNYNRLTSIPDSIGRLRALTDLWLMGNRITSLPESLGNLTRLGNLALNKNRLTSLPESLTRLLDPLALLKIEKNYLTDLPRSFWNVIELSMDLEESEADEVEIDSPVDQEEIEEAEEDIEVDLAEEIGEVDQVEEGVQLPDIYFCPNPFLFISDHDLSKSTHLIDLWYHREACLDYTCQTAPASLFQALIMHKDRQIIEDLFSSLSTQTQEKIREAVRNPSSSSSSSAAVDTVDLFADLSLLGSKLREHLMTLAKEKNLEQEEADSILHWIDQHANILFPIENHSGKRTSREEETIDLATPSLKRQKKDEIN